MASSSATPMKLGKRQIQVNGLCTLVHTWWRELCSQLHPHQDTFWRGSSRRSGDAWGNDSATTEPQCQRDEGKAVALNEECSTSKYSSNRQKYVYRQSCLQKDQIPGLLPPKLHKQRQEWRIGDHSKGIQDSTELLQIYPFSGYCFQEVLKPTTR